MKKGFGLLISLVIAVGMGGYLIYTLIDQNQGKQETQKEQQSRIMIRETQAQAVNTITISNASGSYTLINLGNGLALKDRTAIPYQKDKLQDIVKAAASVTAKQLITHRTARDCGLEMPVVTVTVDYIDKPALTLSLGKEDAEGVCILADDKIYLADQKEMAVFMQSEKDLVSDSLAPERIQNAPVKRISLSGEVRPQPIILEMKEKKGEEDPLRYKMSAPQQAEIAGENVLSWVTPALGLKAEKVVHLNPESRDMTAYGFDKPFSILDMTVGEESFSLIASKSQEGKCYVMRQGVPVVYQVDAGKLPWLTLQVETLVGSLFDPSPVEEVAKVTVSTPNESWIFKLSQEETGFAVTVNEQPLSANRFNALYKKLTKIPPMDYVGGVQPEGQSLLSIQIVYTDDSKIQPDKLSLLPGPEEGLVYLQYNGKTEYTARRSLAEELTEACRKTEEEKDIS